jgi:outer membrane protein TolC
VIKKLIIIPIISSTVSAVSLPELVHMGLDKSSVVQKSELDVKYAEQKSTEVQAGRLGSVDLVASYTRFNLPRTLTPLTPVTMKDPLAAANVATTEDLFGTGISYSVPLFTGFAQTRDIEITALSQQIAQSKSALSQEQLVYNIRSLYLTILATQEMHQAQKNYVKRLKILNDLIRTEVNLGKKAQIDLLKAQSDYQANLSYLEIIQSNIVITKASLATLVGVKEIKNLKSIEVKVKNPQQSIERLLGHTTGLDKIEISQLNLQKADKVIQKSQSSSLPQISLSSYYGHNYGPNDSSNVNSGEWENEKNWQIGLNAKWNLFDFGKSDAVTQQAKIMQMKSKIDYEQTLLELHRSLIEGFEKLKQSYATYQSNIQQLDLAKESEKIESVRYQNDVSTLNDLLYAKSKTNLATAKLIESKYNYQKGNYYMDYLLERGAKQ